MRGLVSRLTRSAAPLLVAAAAGCNLGVGDYCVTGARDEAVVRIEREEVVVRSACDEDGRVGVREMRAANWEGALAALRRSAATDPKEWRTAFALGVCYEMLGREEEALAEYRRANSQISGKGSPEVNAAIARMAAR